MQKTVLAKLILFGTSFLGVSAFADHPIQITFDHPVEMMTPTAQGLGSGVMQEANKPVDLPSDKVVWIQSKGYVPMLILPQSLAAPGEPLKVQLPTVANWPNQETLNAIDQKLSSLTDEVVAFQAAIRSKNVSEAERILTRMEAISRQDYYHFFRASIQFLKGDINSAKDSTNRGLSRFPANEQGQKFLQVLEKKGP